MNMNPIFVLLTSVISSSLAAGVISLSFTEEKERWLLRRTKIEEIYLSSAMWLREASSHFAPYLGVLSGNLSYNAMLDLQIKNDGKDIGMLKLKMEMNISMYEPSMIPLLRVIDAELSKLNTITAGIRDCYQKTGQASQFGEHFKRQLLVWDNAGKALLSAIVNRGATIAAEQSPTSKAYRNSIAFIRCKSQQVWTVIQLKFKNR